MYHLDEDDSISNLINQSYEQLAQKEDMLIKLHDKFRLYRTTIEDLEREVEIKIKQIDELELQVEEKDNKIKEQRRTIFKLQEKN